MDLVSIALSKSYTNKMIPDKPVDIPTKTSQLENDSNYVTEEQLFKSNRDFVENPIDLSDEVTGVLPVEKIDPSAIFSGDYNDLLNKPDIPSLEDLELGGSSGEDGFSPQITVAKNTDTEYVLTITTKDDVFDTPNLMLHMNKVREKVTEASECADVINREVI